MATILNSAILESALHCGIQTPCFLLSDSLKNTLPPLWLWLKLIQSDSNSFILTQLDDGSHLEFCHLGFSICTVEFRHLVIFSQNHSKTLSLHSDSGSNQFNLTQTQTFLLNLILAVFLNSAILNSAILDSGILVFPLKLTHTYQDWFPLFAQKKNFTHTSLPTICTKKTSLIHSDSTYWWWPSWILPYWILPYWIQLLHCGIQASCFLLSDSFKNPLPPLWLWHKLIQFD